MVVIFVAESFKSCQVQVEIITTYLLLFLYLHYHVMLLCAILYVI